MAAHPDVAAKVRAANRSYVFLRVTGLTNEGEPVGAQGVPLTPGRSIAVDRVHQYGTPFIEADHRGPQPASSFHRLMIAQDTGSGARCRAGEDRTDHSRPLMTPASQATRRARCSCGALSAAAFAKPSAVSIA
jgi:membrane-bound lytic murein transglycosylase